MDINKNDVGFRISTIRKRLGLTMANFGEIVGNASDSIVSRWEKGKSLPNNNRLKKISELGGISINELLYGDFKNYCFDIFNEEHKKFIKNDAKEYKLDITEIDEPKNKMSFFQEVFDDFIIKNDYDYEDSDKIANAYRYLVTRKFYNEIEYTNERAINFANDYLSCIESGLFDYFYISPESNDYFNKEIGDGVIIQVSDKKREDAIENMYIDLMLVIKHAINEVEAIKQKYHVTK